MHNKYARDGLVVVSVCLLVDSPPTPQYRAKVETFLKEQKSTLNNFILLEGEGGWQKRLNIDGPPLVFVFDKDNHFTRKLKGEEQVKYDLIEREVVNLLGK